MHRRIALTIALLGASSALAAPKIDGVTVQPHQPKFSGGKAPEVEVSVAISRGRFDSGNCDARVDFGDGEGRTLDFGVAAKRTVRHVYKKSGSFTVVARGAGATPCEGMQQMPLIVTGAAEPTKKAPTKKKADEKKKPDSTKASVKKDEKKKSEVK